MSKAFNIEECHFALPVRCKSTSDNFIKLREERLSRRTRQSHKPEEKHHFINYEKARLLLSVQSITKFGSDGIHWTIGSSRSPPKEPDYVPPVGSYDVPTSGLNTARRSKIGEKRPEKRFVNYDNETHADRVFPEIRPMQIGEKDNKTYFNIPQTPGPTYMPPGFGDGRKHIICKKRDEDANRPKTPGPGNYSPKDPGMKSEPSYSVPRCKSSSYFDRPMNNNPGPGTYTVEKPAPKAPQWTKRSIEKSERFKRLCQQRDRPWAY